MCDSCDNRCVRNSAAGRRMFCLSRPNRNAIAAFLSSQQDQTYSYADVGYSRQQTPKGYVADHNRIVLGKGVETFERAKRAVRNWKMFDKRLWGRLALNRLITSNRPGQKRGQLLISRITGQVPSVLRRVFFRSTEGNCFQVPRCRRKFCLFVP